MHKAKHIGPQGQVSPLCAPKPRALDLKRAGWTIRPEAVTCKKCLAIMATTEPAKTINKPTP